MRWQHPTAMKTRTGMATFCPAASASRSPCASDAAAGRPTLVVVPLSVLSQWHRELQAFSAPQALAVLVYYGPDRPTDPNFLRSQDVVISTYGTLQSDYAAAVGGLLGARGGGGGGAAALAAMSNADGSITGNRSGLFGVRWGRVVLDEVRCMGFGCCRVWFD